MGSREGAAKARAAFLARVRAGEIVVTGKAGDGVVRPLVPVQRVYVPAVRLLGRAVMALVLGPLTLAELADRCGVEVEELEAIAALLRPHVQAIRLGEVWLVFGRWESWSAVHEARARVLDNTWRAAA